jgi:hypothetical protein
MSRFLLFFLAFSSPLIARADDASRHAKAVEMVTLAHLDRLSTEVIDTLLQQTASITMQRAGGTLTPAQKTALEDFQKKLVVVIEPQVGWKAMEPAFADLYAKTFTEDQMDAIIVFYKSPAGIVLMDKMPEINQQANQMMQAKIIGMQAQVRQMFADFEKSQAPATPPATNAPATPTKPALPAPGPPK